MGLVINNMDLLFQENFIDKKCEILVPYFIEKTNVKINIKDYIEVNSAIALAMQGLETKNQQNNFNPKANRMENIRRILMQDVGKSNKAKVKKNKTKSSLKQVMSSEMDSIERMLLRGTVTVLLIIVLYIGTTEVLSKQINEKMVEAEKAISATTKQIEKIEQYKTAINAKTNEYTRIMATIDETNSKISENYSSKNAIPNLLTKIMFTVPTGVQILLIENPSEKDITIVAQAEKYDQLGYFKAALEEEGILTDITTSNAKKQTNLISITIKGKLNY